MRPTPSFIKLPYSLKDQPFDQRISYYQYLAIRSHANTFTQKPGFISRKETQTVADSIGISRAQLYRRLRTLLDYGYSIKTQYGYIIKSFDKVNKSLSLDQYWNQRSSSYEFYNDPRQDRNNNTPYKKINIQNPDVRKIELAHHYVNLVETASRIKYRTRSNANKNILSTSKEAIHSPERFRFVISLETLTQKGNHLNKMYVKRLNDDLENIGLLNITRGKFNTYSLQNDCNKYSLNHYSKVNWRLLDKVVKNRTSTVTTTTINGAVKNVKPQRTLTDVEQRFLTFIEYAKPILVDKNVLSSTFMKRKVSRTMIPNLLGAVLASEFLRLYFFKHFSFENINVKYKKSVWLDNKAIIYDRFVDFGFDRCELVSTAGNYDGREIRTYKEQLYQSMDDRRAMYDDRLWRGGDSI